MIRADMIPDEVVEAAAKELAYTNGWRNQQGVEACKPVVKDIIRTALNAWPFGAVCHYTIKDTEGWELVLPLPQEASDE